MENTSQPPIVERTDLPERKEPSLTLLLSGVALVVAVIAGGIGYYLGSMQKIQTTLPGQEIQVTTNPELNQVACTMEAKLCPNGSSVGRSGPNCEFAECPTSDLKTDESARGGGVEADWPTYADPYHGYIIKYPPTWQLNKSTCAKCAMNLIKNPITLPDGTKDTPSTIGILIFDSNSQELKDWKNTEIVEQNDFSWTNIQGVDRIEKRNDFLQLGEHVQMEVLYVEKGSKTYVIYINPSILPVENAILSSLVIK